MKIKFIYKILPVFVFYTDKFLQPWQGGRSLGLIAIIRPTQENNTGILLHELQHSKQFYTMTAAAIIGTTISALVFGGEYAAMLYASSPGAYFAARRFIPDFKYNCEIAAFREHLKAFEPSTRGAHRMNFAKDISEYYNLPKKYSVARAYSDLSG